MQRIIPGLQTSRRRFTLLLGAGLLGVPDNVFASLWQDTPDTPRKEFWTIGENRLWWWYERHKKLDYDWKITGITTPIHKESGKPYTGQTGYLEETLVTEHIRELVREVSAEQVAEASKKYAEHQATAAHKARDGRPPSEWIRSLTTTELRVWLRTIEVPEAGVSGMTCWCHLVRDHSFDPYKIEGLTQDEQDELHSAAHFGY